MPDPEITKIREIIAARPRAAEIAQMRIDSDARGEAIPLPADVTVQPVTANGVQAEWTSTPNRRPIHRHSLSPWRRLRASVRCKATATWSPRPDAPPAPAPWHSTTGWPRNIRFRRRSKTPSQPIDTCWTMASAQTGSRWPETVPVAGSSWGPAGHPRSRPAAAGLRVVHLALGRHGGPGPVVHR